jgi:hypothetical protein
MDAVTFFSDIKKDCTTLLTSDNPNDLHGYLFISLVLRIGGVAGVVFAGFSFITILAAASPWAPFYLAAACLDLILSHDVFMIGCNLREAVCTINDPVEEPNLLKKIWLLFQSIFIRLPKIAIKEAVDQAPYMVHKTWVALPLYHAYQSMIDHSLSSSFEISM